MNGLKKMMQEIDYQSIWYRMRKYIQQKMQQSSLRRHINNIGLKERMIFYFSVATSTILILFGLVHYQMTASRLEREAQATAAQMIGNACNDINEMFLQAYHICLAMNDDVSMQQLIGKNFSTQKEQFSYDLMGSMEIMRLPSYNSNLFGVYVLGDNGGRYKSNYLSFYVEDLRAASWYRIIHATGRAQWFPPHENSYVVQTPGISCVSIGIPFIDKTTGRTKGVVLAEIESERLSAVAARSVSSNGDVFLMDEKNQIMNLSALPEGESLWKNEDSVLNARKMVEDNLKEIPEYGKAYVLESKKELIVYQTLNQADWKIVGVIPKAAIVDSVRYIKILMIMLVAVAIIVSIFMAELLANSVTKPIDILVAAMGRVYHGDLDIKVETKRCDEIGMLYQAFNHMVFEMKNLIETIYENQEQLRIGELKALQAQINPHFLYNTLDSIIWSLRMNQVTGSIEMLAALTEFFKIGLSNGRDIITFDEELRHANSYLHIQHQRYADKFDYDINVGETLLPYRIPKLILQPFIENAIYHGLKLLNEKGYLYIHAYEQEDDIWIQIEDTGIGIAAHRVAAINQELKTISSGQQGTGYGIRNVNDRIKIVYGGDYGVFIESQAGAGTIVRIHLCKQGGETNESDYL